MLTGSGQNFYVWLFQVVALAKCTVSEVKSDDSAEVHYRGIRVTYEGADSLNESLILLTNSVNEKAQWLADFSQCVENERQNKILQCQRYSTHAHL